MERVKGRVRDRGTERREKEGGRGDIDPTGICADRRRDERR